MHSQSSGSQTQTITRPPEASPMNQSGEAVRVVVDRFERVRAQVARTEVSQAERDVGSSVRRSVLESWNRAHVANPSPDTRAGLASIDAPIPRVRTIIPDSNSRNSIIRPDGTYRVRRQSVDPEEAQNAADAAQNPVPPSNSLMPEWATRALYHGLQWTNDAWTNHPWVATVAVVGGGIALKLLHSALTSSTTPTTNPTPGVNVQPASPVPSSTPPP